MTPEQIRAEYEKEFPVPPQTMWSDTHGGYINCAPCPNFPAAVHQEGWVRWQAAHARYAGRESEGTIQRLRGQLQNCVNHIERLKRHHPRETEKLEACIHSANKCLYETLHDSRPTPAVPEVTIRELLAAIDAVRDIQHTGHGLPEYTSSSVKKERQVWRNLVELTNEIEAMLTQATKESDK